MKYDIYLVGVGGQGVLTIADLITMAAHEQNIPVNYYPTKGMAQRGGFVKAQVRLGRAVVGPQIPEGSADLVIATELSEALRAVRYATPGGEFLLYGHVWQPTAVLLGKAPYPSLDSVRERIEAAGATLHYLDPAKLPRHQGQPVSANVYVLGAAVGNTALGQHLETGAVARLIENRWRRGGEANQLAFRSGAEA